MWPLLIAAAGSTIAQLIASGQREKAAAELRKALDRFGDVALPDLQKVIAEQVQKSEAGAVTADPDLRSAEYAALDSLKSVSDAGGLTTEDRAALNKVNNATSRRESAGRAAIKNDAEARGIGGGGYELAMKMAGNQDSGQRLSEEGMTTTGRAQSRALEAMMARGRMAGQMNERDFSQRARAADARDAMARYNTDRRTDANYYNAGLDQKRFGAQMQRAGAQAGMNTQLAGAGFDQAQNTQNSIAAVGQAGAEAYKATQPRSFDDLDAYIKSLNAKS